MAMSQRTPSHCMATVWSWASMAARPARCPKSIWAVSRQGGKEGSRPCAKIIPPRVR